MMALWPEACPALASISGGMAVVMSGKYCVILLMARATRASHSEFTSFASAPTEDGLALNDDAAAVDFFEGGVYSLTEALTLACLRRVLLHPRASRRQACVAWGA